MWTQQARRFLKEGNASVAPWATLMDFDGPPEELLQLCAEKIEREAHAKDRADLLAVSQVFTGLRFPDPELLQWLGGEKPMIESPVLQKLMAKRVHGIILALLKDRFGRVPQNLVKLLGEVVDDRKLTDLSVFAAKCEDLDAFREAILK
jgi:hypothetical protein